MRKLVIKDLHVAVGDKEILKGINLTINKGEIHVIMGPNGSGKTTTAHCLIHLWAIQTTRLLKEKSI